VSRTTTPITAGSTRPSTQNARLLAALRDRGPEGITQLDFDGYSAAVFDGGKPIRRLASRINDLRNDGYEITSRALPNRIAVYVLKGSAPEGMRLRAVPEPEPEPERTASLFDVAPVETRRARGPYDVDAA
jgi:hypothetical protein